MLRKVSGADGDPPIDRRQLTSDPGQRLIEPIRQAQPERQSTSLDEPGDRPRCVR